MNVIDFFRRQTELWNEENKCGFCWGFGAPLTDSGINESQIKTDLDECCPVNVYITNLSQRENRIYNNTTNLLQNYTIDYTLTLNILALDRIDTNVYSEQTGHPISESKWEDILYPLQKCVCQESILEFCRIICKNIKILNWNAITRINWLDNNYTGWSITMTLRDYDCTDNNCDDIN